MKNYPKKKFLLIVNSAAYSREYFVELGAALKALGAEVFYVLDSHLSDVMGGSGEALPGAWYFTDYCAKRGGRGPRKTQDATLKWDVLFSDFDRFVTFNMVPPLKKSGSMDYAETVSGLHDFFEDVFDGVRPDAVVYEQVSNSFAMMAYRAATRRDIPFFSLAPARIAGHVEISPTGALRDHVTVGALLDEFKRTGCPPEARRIAENYIASIDEQVPDYMRASGSGAVLMTTSLTKKYGNRETLRRLIRVLRYRRSRREDLALAYQFGDPLAASWALFRRAVKRRLQFKSVSKLYQDKVRSPEYFLYPLHFHPEASTSVLASDYVNELSVIQAIAFRLPIHVKLVVKEHPSATALQPLSFYRALDALPNVELVGPGLNAKDLARKSVGVICLTSTLGLEAAALNKPVICFGDVLFGYFPNVRMIEHYGALDGALEWAMQYKPLDPEEIVVAMAAYVEYVDPGSFGFRETLQDAGAINHIANLLMSKLLRREGEGDSRDLPAARVIGQASSS